MVSAIKVGGRKLYELAREGEEVERAPRPVQIDELDVEEFVARRVPRGDDPGRLLERHVRSHAGGRSRNRARRLRAPRPSCAGCASARSPLDEAHSLDAIEAEPDARVLAPADGDARSRTRSWSTPSTRARSRTARPSPRPRCSATRRGRRTVRRRRRARRAARGLRAARRRREARGRAGDGGGRREVIWRDPADVDCRTGRNGRAVAIGAFDGVHLGHQAVLRLVRDLAHARGLRVDGAHLRPSPGRGRAARLGAEAADDARTEARAARGDRRGRRMPRAPVRRGAQQGTGRSTSSSEVLAACSRARLVVVGADFHFGYRRHGDVPLLQRMGAELGFEVIGLGLVARPTMPRPTAASPYSSTQRAPAARAPATSRARPTILGRPHEVRGPVEHGDGAGASSASRPRTSRARAHLPPARRRVRGHVRRPPTASSARRRSRSAGGPTFYEEPGLFLLEAHVLDFDGDLYGQPARVRFLHRLAGPGALRRRRRPDRPDGPRRARQPATAGPADAGDSAARVW